MLPMRPYKRNKATVAQYRPSQPTSEARGRGTFNRGNDMIRFAVRHLPAWRWLRNLNLWVHNP